MVTLYPHDERESTVLYFLRHVLLPLRTVPLVLLFPFMEVVEFLEVRRFRVIYETSVGLYLLVLIRNSFPMQIHRIHLLCSYSKRCMFTGFHTLHIPSKWVS